MGASKQRKEAFFKEHPLCCFCGGEKSAETVDHVPLRAAFSKKIGPEGFEFPACSQCNRSSSGSEQVFALYVRLMDHTDENYDQDHLGKLIQGVRNNFPDLLPNARLPAIEKRRVLRHFGWERPRNEFLDDLGIVSVPKAVGGHIEHNARKILAALHYRHTGFILTDQSGTFVGWSQQGLPGVDDAHEILLSGMPELVVGSRVNTSIGDQFSYRWGVDSKINLFGFAAAFGTGLFMFGACAPWDIVQDKENWLRFAL